MPCIIPATPSKLTTNDNFREICGLLGKNVELNDNDYGFKKNGNFSWKLHLKLNFHFLGIHSTVKLKKKTILIEPCIISVFPKTF
jgi:hypothetical protein